MTALAMHLSVGFTVNFPEEPDTVQENLREIGPHVMFSPPRIWEDMVTRVQVRIQDAGWLKRRLWEFFLAWGSGWPTPAFAHRPVPLKDRLLVRPGRVPGLQRRQGPAGALPAEAGLHRRRARSGPTSSGSSTPWAST